MNNLRQYSVPVKKAVYPNEPMGIGLWFSESAVTEALQDGNWQELHQFLDDNHLVPNTFNAFPYSDFHQPVVKHLVYEPDWTTDERKEYTLNVATLQTRLLPEGSIGTISTLPLGWRHSGNVDPGYFEQCSVQLGDCASTLAKMQQQSGITIRLCLEPEPGCVLQTSDQVQMLFQWYLHANAANETTNREFLGVCHDVCHSAVMFEPQVEALNRFREAGICIGKVQVSSAIEISRSNPAEEFESLRQFIEPRYLHQTNLKTAESISFFEDLDQALQQKDLLDLADVLRAHFHVPIMIESTPEIGTTQHDIKDCLDWFVDNEYESQFEVETYAWDVTPESVRGGSMVDSIISELRWLRSAFPAIGRFNQV